MPSAGSRKRYYSPSAVDALADLDVSTEEFDAIDSKVKALAEGKEAGYVYLFQSTSSSWYAADVARFRLVYRLIGDELEVAAVVVA